MHEISSLEIHRLVNELQDIKGKHIKKFYELKNGSFRISLSDNVSLFIKPAGTINKTLYAEDTNITNFASAIRKRIDNRTITDIRQLGSDRIIEIEINNGEMKLIVEMFNKGNMLLLDTQGKIDLAYKYSRQKDRAIEKGASYDTNRSKPIWQLKKEEILNTIKDALGACSGEQLARTLIKAIEIGPIYVEELIARCTLDPKEACSSAHGKEEELAHTLSKLISEAESGKALLYRNGERTIDYSIIELQRYSNIENVKYNTLGELMDMLYLPSRKSISTDENAEKAIKELEASISKQKVLIDSLEKNALESRSIATYIFEHMGEINSIIDYLRNNKNSTAEEVSERFNVKVKKIDLKDKKIVIEV